MHFKTKIHLTFTLHSRRSTDKAWLTPTVVASRSVHTGRVSATWLRIAFVDIDTARSIGLESGLTETLTFYAFGVGGALGIGFA